MTSETYADLGGGLTTARPARTHHHRFDAISGYCGCGRRDDGMNTAVGSPAWRLEQQAAHA